MTTSIVYYSTTGHTAHYAELLSQRLGLPAYSLDSSQLPPDNSPIIFLSWLSASSLKNYKKAAIRFDIKAVVATGAGDKASDQVEEVRKRNAIPAEQAVFYMQGGINWDKMKGMDKILMLAMRQFVGKPLLKKADATAAEKSMAELWMKGGSRVDAANLEPLVEWYQAQG